MNRLKDKVALVTAAGQGIGKATAIAFHNEGAKVIATDINDTTLNELNKEYPKIEVKNLDATNKDTIKNYISTISKIDILFNEPKISGFDIVTLFELSLGITLS